MSTPTLVVQTDGVTLAVASNRESAPLAVGGENPLAAIPVVAEVTLRYDPAGPDRDCGDFDTHDEAQSFFIAAGGPDSDPHRLDCNNDGVTCESLRSDQARYCCDRRYSEAHPG